MSHFIRESLRKDRLSKQNRLYNFKRCHKVLTHGGFTNSSSDTGEKCVLCRLQARLATPGKELVSFANMPLSIILQKANFNLQKANCNCK